VNAGAFDYRTFTTASFSRGDWNVALRWRHLPSIKPSAIVSNPATNIIDTPSYDAFDLSGGYTFGESWQLRYGVDNVFDEQPLFTNATRYTRGTAVNGGFYDVLGRRAYVPGLAASPESRRAMRPTSQRAVASIVADGVRRLESRRVLRFGCRPTR
jgi:outer membrane receptor protein involved in Fe transport